MAMTTVQASAAFRAVYIAAINQMHYIHKPCESYLTEALTQLGLTDEEQDEAYAGFMFDYQLKKKEKGKEEKAE